MHGDSASQYCYLLLWSLRAQTLSKRFDERRPSFSARQLKYYLKELTIAHDNEIFPSRPRSWLLIKRKMRPPWHVGVQFVEEVVYSDCTVSIRLNK